MSGNKYLAPIAAKLTVNAAINLRSAIKDPCPLNPNAVHGKGRIFTGLGKWTTLAAIGVQNNMISLGLAEKMSDERRLAMIHITPLGREVAQYLHDHWEELKFREPRR